ncbi:sialate O-acetylesterase [Rubrolithibacter danxiaensis]|uniref:sialate O-acetylesterase n=1 Tax=Rubrolithibacter danxiaensis TaxID=3390805 RepID=UPI003BF79D75
MKKKEARFFSALLFLGASLIADTSEAKVILPAFFTNNMVLQQKDQVPLWGSAAPDKTVNVFTSWNNKKYTAKADNKGNWKVTVSTPAYGGPYSVTFDDGDALTLSNILIGEVWVCSGQSNMEMPLAGWGKIKNYEQEIAAANYPEIRLLQVQKATSIKPLKNVKVDADSWQVCSPATIPGFSSVAYFFAKNIYESKHVPIGLIHTSWGGTIAEAWTSGPSLKKMPEFAQAVEEMQNDPDFEKNIRKKFEVQLEAWNKKLTAKDPGYKDGKALWATSNLDASAWKTMNLPELWEKEGLTDFDGLVWFRKKVTIPQSWSDKELTLSLGPIDDNDVTFFNGKEIGRTQGYDKARVYTIPAGEVKAGENTIAVQVFDGSGGGGIYGSPDQLFIKNSSGEKISLTGDWKYQVSIAASEIDAMPYSPEGGPNRPTVLYNSMIHPLIPYAFRGVIWYQGESNASRAYQYKELFPLMINDWRKNWNRGNFPFYFVQLANFMDKKEQPAESEWAELREAQKATLSLSNTGMAVAIDIGEAKDIHPKNKQEVGRRLALIARAEIYGEKIPFSGPMYQSMKVVGDKIRLSFTHTGNGLKIKEGGKLKGFAVAGADHKFYWADAKIKGNEVIVSSDQVKSPVAVRYAWADNPDANLYNGADLPASPFRTDNWPGLTINKK